jgi:hypothetical protein
MIICSFILPLGMVVLVLMPIILSLGVVVDCWVVALLTSMPLWMTISLIILPLGIVGDCWVTLASSRVRNVYRLPLIPFQSSSWKINFYLGFLYKEGDDDFRKDDINGRLTNLGTLSLQHWKSGIFQKQACNTCTVEGDHGQATFLEFVQVMQQYHGPDI